ncbi:MAG: hypothetical protein RJA91_997 [Pseudomonadota bacterium]|jgi:hypothetical protein
MQDYDYSETLAYYLMSSSREINMGPEIRQYKLDQNQTEYFFFTKMPDTTLNIVVYEIFGGELHEVDSDAFRVRRFLFKPTKLVDEELYNFMLKDGFHKTTGKYESRYLIAFPYKDGIVYASKSCRWNFGEVPEVKIR